MAKRQTRGLLPQDAQSQNNLLQSIASQNVTPVSPGNQGGFDRVGGASFGSYGGMVGRPQLYGGAADALDAANAVSGLASSLIQYKNTKKRIKANNDNDSIAALEQEWLDEQEKWKAAREKDAVRMRDETLALGLEGIDQRDIVASYHGIEPEELSYLLSTNKEEYMRLVDALPIHFSSSKQRDAWSTMSTKTKGRLRTKEAKLSLSKSSAQMGAQLDKHESSLLRSQFQGIVAELENIPGLSQQEAEDALQSWFDFNLKQNPSLAEDGVWVDIMDNQIDTAAKTINSARARELNGFVDGLAEAGVPDELINITLSALENGDLEVLGPLLLAGGLDDDLEETTNRIASELLADPSQLLAILPETREALSQDPAATPSEDEVRGLALRLALQETRGEVGIENFSPAEITDVIVSLLTTFREDDPEGMFDEDSLVEVGKALGLDPEFFKRENGVFSWGSKFLPSSVLLEEKLKEVVSPVVENKMETIKEARDLLRTESTELFLREDILTTGNPSVLPWGNIQPRGLRESQQDYLERIEGIIEGRAVAINERIEAELNRFVNDPDVTLDRVQEVLGFSDNGLWGTDENGFLSDSTLDSVYLDALEKKYQSLPKDQRDEIIEVRLRERKKQHRQSVLDALAQSIKIRVDTVVDRSTSNGIINNPNLNEEELNVHLFGMMYSELVDVFELQNNMQRNLPGLPTRVLDPNEDLRLRFLSEADVLAIIQETGKEPETVNGFVIEKVDTLTGESLSVETPPRAVAEAIQTGVSAIRRAVDTNSRGTNSTSRLGKISARLNDPNNTDTLNGKELRELVEEVRENHGDDQADSVLALGVNSGVELDIFDKRGNKPSLAYDAATGDDKRALQMFEYRWKADSTGYAATRGDVLADQTIRLSESKNEQERYLGYYLQYVDYHQRAGEEESGVVKTDWETTHHDAKRRAEAMSRGKTRIDFKNLEDVIYGQKTKSGDYDKAYNLLDMIAGVVGDANSYTDGFGITQERSVLGITFFGALEKDLDAGWDEMISGFNMEDPETVNFWRHMVSDLVMDLGTSADGTPRDIFALAEDGRGLIWGRTDVEKSVGTWLSTNVRSSSGGSGKYVLVKADSTHRRPQDGDEHKFRIIYDPGQHLHPDLKTTSDMAKVNFGAVRYSPDGLTHDDDTIRVGTQGITNVVSFNEDQMLEFGKQFLDQFHSRHGNVLKIPEEYLPLLSNEEGWQDEWVTNPTMLDFVELLKSDPEPQDIITFVNKNGAEFVDLPFSITDTGTIEDAYYSLQLPPNEWRTTNTWGDGVELYSSLTNGAMPDVGFYRLLGTPGTTKYDLILYAAGKGNLADLHGKDPEYTYSSQSLFFAPLPMSERDSWSYLTTPPGYRPNKSETWIGPDGEPIWREFVQHHEGHPLRLQFANTAGEILSYNQQNPSLHRVGFNRETGEFEHESTGFPLLRTNRHAGVGHLVPPAEIPLTFWRGVVDEDHRFFRDPEQERTLRIEDHLGKPLMFRDPRTGETELVKIPKVVDEGESYRIGTSRDKNGNVKSINLKRVGNTFVVVKGFQDAYGNAHEAMDGSVVMYPFTAVSSHGSRALQELRGEKIDDADARAIEIQLQRGLLRGQRVRVGRGGGLSMVNDPTLPIPPVDPDYEQMLKEQDSD